MTDREAIYLGALLHDVGKFWQRTNEGIPRDKHQQLSAAFVNNLLKDERVNAIVANHHKEGGLTGIRKAMAEIVCEADNLSSGERKEDKQVLEQQPMLSIFCSISTKEHPFSERIQQPLSRLTPAGYQFPASKAHGNLNQEYAKRWEEFSKDCEQIDHNDTLLPLYRKYLWCVPPPSYNNAPDVSLYEHSRLAAAIAVCLYDYFYEQLGDSIASWKNIENRSEERYLLICGDITGIQNYIYGIGHKGALKALKGRSFFLQHLTSVFAEILLEKMDLKPANLIYASGGKFYILAPHTTATSNVLADCSRDFEEKLLEEYEGDIGIVIGSVPLKGSDFGRNPETKKSPITEKWALVSDGVNEQKKRKFSQQFTPDFFAPFGPSGNVQQCHATGRDLCEKEEVPEMLYKQEIFPAERDNDGDDNEHFISREQHFSQEIGRNLKEARFMTSGNIAGFSVLKLRDFDFLSRRREGAKTYLFNNDDVIGKADDWIFYGGNWSVEGDFDKLVKQCSGIARLGVLRMDVDNLGSIFKDGLGAKATFSRVVQLSTMLDFFFSSYLNILKDKKWDIEQRINDAEGKPLGNMMQIVYAGGDDMFIVGAWNVLPDVALWIRHEFARYTCGNPNFTISAGISLFPAAFPLAKAAALAGDAEAHAKGERRNKHGKLHQKNALCFLDVAMSWSDAEIVRRHVDSVVRCIEQAQNRGLIDRLLRISAEFEDGKGNRWAQWRWRACYSLARYGEQNKTVREAVQELSAELLSGAANSKTEQDLISLLGVIAQWADFLTRKEK